MNILLFLPHAKEVKEVEEVKVGECIKSKEPVHISERDLFVLKVIYNYN